LNSLRRVGTTFGHSPVGGNKKKGGDVTHKGSKLGQPKTNQGRGPSRQDRDRRRVGGDRGWFSQAISGTARTERQEVNPKASRNQTRGKSRSPNETAEAERFQQSLFFRGSNFLSVGGTHPDLGNERVQIKALMGGGGRIVPNKQHP